MRKQLKGLAYGMASRFVSRYNDIDGYWALGVLYSAVTAAGTNSLCIDLVRETVDTPFNNSVRVLSELNFYMRSRLEKLNLAGAVVCATINVEFNIAPRADHPHRRSARGQPFVCVVTITDDLGRARKGTAFSFCDFHDSTIESRRSQQHRFR